MPRHRPIVETSDYLAACARMLRAAGRRVANADPDDLAQLVALRAELDHIILTAVAGMRAQEWTWQSIGEALGVTRQAAILRWSAKVDELARQGSPTSGGTPARSSRKT